MIILIRNLHSIIFKLAPALEWSGPVPVLGTKPQWWPLADCQIQESFRFEPGSLGFTMAVPAFISSTVNTLKWIIWSGDAPSFISWALHCVYSLQWTDICRFIFFTLALKWVLTALHGGTQITWEYWKVFSAIRSLMRFKWWSAWDIQWEISNSAYSLPTFVIVLIFWFVWVASTHKQLLPFPYLHMFSLIFTYATMDDISIPWIAQLCLVSKHMFV